MKRMSAGALVVSLACAVTVAEAQWLNRPTPNIPRTSDGRPDLTAAAPRGADGHVDLSGVWNGRPAVIRVPDDALTERSKTLIHEREENYFSDRPAFQCLPSGPETMVGWRRIIQTPSLIAIAHENLTYRLVYMDGRTLEPNPERTWMGYSVGRWESDTLVVDSFGFNDRTWLDGRGLPHTEALRTTERFVRRTVGQLQVELTVTDPGAFEKSWSTSYTLNFQADTDMVEGVCEDRTRWIGRLSESEKAAVAVSPATLVRYVGVYSGLWGTLLRTVRVELEGGVLYLNGVLNERVRLIPHSDWSFSGTDGLSFEFDPSGNPAAFMVERHVSGDYRYTRQPATR